MKKERKNRGLSAGLVLAALLTIWAASLSAQNVTGTILGTVTDPRGGVIPKVTVTITNADQKVVLRTGSADDHGQFVVPGLPVGHYDVAAETTGFKKSIQSGIVLNVDDKVAVNFSLDVGSVSETVHVEANALQVDTETATAT